MTMILCVLRSGGDFNVGHVMRLARQVLRHSPAGTPFVCFTDLPADAFECDAIRLKHDWPGWWSKLEALTYPGPALYLDLDVTITGDLSPLLDAAAEHSLLMIRSLWGPDDPNLWNSSVMGWKGYAPASLADVFADDPERWQKECSQRDRWGDQGFIRLNYRGSITAWQDVLPGQVMSFKRAIQLGHDGSDMRVCVSHGQPRPWAAGGADAWLAKRGRAT